MALFVTDEGEDVKMRMKLVSEGRLEKEGAIYLFLYDGSVREGTCKLVHLRVLIGLSKKPYRRRWEGAPRHSRRMMSAC